MIQTHNPSLLFDATLVMWQLKISLPITLYKNLTEFPPTNTNFASTEAELHSHCHVDDGMLFRYLYILGARRTKDNFP